MCGSVFQMHTNTHTHVHNTPADGQVTIQRMPIKGTNHIDCTITRLTSLVPSISMLSPKCVQEILCYIVNTHKQERSLLKSGHIDPNKTSFQIHCNVLYTKQTSLLRTPCKIAVMGYRCTSVYGGHCDELETRP